MQFIIGRQPPTKQKLKYVVDGNGFWKYENKPLLLRGGTTDNNMFNNDITSVHAELDYLASLGGNYVRLTLSGVTIPSHIIANGETTLYDLTKINPTFLARIDDFISYCSTLGIIVQIDLWEKFLYFNLGGAWDVNPFNPENNINYTEANTTLTVTQERDTTSNPIPTMFLNTVPSLNNDTVVLSHQKYYIDEILNILFEYDNILFNLDNEHSNSLEWSYYWEEYVRNKALEYGKNIFISEMANLYTLVDNQVTLANDVAKHTHFDFFEGSQFTHANNGGDALWNNLSLVRRAIGEDTPINMEKIYGGTANTHGTVQEGIINFYISLMFGVAALRQHRSPEGIGGSSFGLQQIKTVKDIEDIVGSFAHMTSDIDFLKIINRGIEDAYLCYSEGNSYVAYLLASTMITIDTSLESGEFACRWVNLDDGSVTLTSNETFGVNVSVTQPHSNAYGWVVVFTKGYEDIPVVIPTTNYVINGNASDGTNGWEYRYGTFVVENGQFRLDTDASYGGMFDKTLDGLPASITSFRLVFTCTSISSGVSTYVVIKDASGGDIISGSYADGTHTISFIKPEGDTSIQLYLLLKTAGAAYFDNIKIEET